MSIQYRVVYSERIYEQLQAIERTAQSEGRVEEFSISLAAIMKAMRLVPNELGESRELYPHLRLQGRIYFIGSLTVEFGVHLDQPLVFVRKFKWRQK